MQKFHELFGSYHLINTELGWMYHHPHMANYHQYVWLKVFVGQEQKMEGFILKLLHSLFWTVIYFRSSCRGSWTFKYSFSWGILEPHMPEVSDMMVTCRVTDWECDGCQHVLLTQGSDVTAAGHSWSSFRMKRIFFFSDDDWKTVRINNVGRKKTIKKKRLMFEGKFCEILAMRLKKK